MKATGQELVAVVPFGLAFCCYSQQGAPVTGVICLQGYIFACENQLCVFLASAIGDISTTWSEKNWQICFALTGYGKTSSPPSPTASLCIMPWPIWAVKCTTCSVFVITFIEGGKCTPNCCARRSRLACQFAVLYTTSYCPECEVYGEWVSDGLSLHLTVVKGSPGTLCLQLL